jgi:excinuclease ABC subunit A
LKADLIQIRGARQHNLKNIDLDIPRNKLVVITGLSGSGKSTLAFDTIYAEGQRRYVESLSAYARQFLERMPKPDLDFIEGLSPAIAIDQGRKSHNPRSTVGTITEIYDYLRLLYARIGKPHCHECNRPIASQSIDQMVDILMDYPVGTRMIVLAPLINRQKGTHAALIKRLKKDGYARLRVNGEIISIEDLDSLAKGQYHCIDVVVDRIVLNNRIRNRVADSMELALSLSDGKAKVSLPGEHTSATRNDLVFTEKAACPTCGISQPEISPASFSFNSPHGACPQCDGLGTGAEFDIDRIVPDAQQSIAEGAVRIWPNRHAPSFQAFLEAFASQYASDLHAPFQDLPEPFKTALMYGSGDTKIRFETRRGGRNYDFEQSYEGLIPQLMRRYRETESSQTREELKRFMRFDSCKACKGARLRPESRAVTVGGSPIHELTGLSISKCVSFLHNLNLNGRDAQVAGKIVKELLQRIEFLQDVGLPYLSLDRRADTLSGGESQRIHLATQIGAKLTGVLYVLDEPSIGLHPRDNQRLLQTLLKMRDQGNSLLLVEHDPSTIMASDYVIDMGPEAGANGGHIIFKGPPQAMLTDDRSLTGQYFSGRMQIPVPIYRRIDGQKQIVVSNARRHNLKEIQVIFPLECLVCVTGVSGSGKSTLVIDTLFRAFSVESASVKDFRELQAEFKGLEHIDKVINIDQAPIGRTPRSNPGTYTGIFNLVRDLFSKTPDARVRGFSKSRFSFNVKGGRCEACKGDGMVKIEMHFLPDVYVPCDICNGKRYNRETLEVCYKGKNIVEVLDLTVNQAMRFFDRIGPIREKLQTLIDVGLGYLHLGQTANTLSGGEAQRVKLARELSKRATGRTLYILDEPTTGLHSHDINKLLQVLNRLVDLGNSVIVIEHNLDVIKCADHVIDLGPEGGDGGGYVLGYGTPEEIAGLGNSYTGQYLAESLQ